MQINGVVYILYDIHIIHKIIRTWALAVLAVFGYDDDDEYIICVHNVDMVNRRRSAYIIRACI